MNNKKGELLLRKAEKNNLFRDIICPNCDIVYDIDWKKQKINNKGIWFYCPKCRTSDVIGWDIIEENAKINSNK